MTERDLALAGFLNLHHRGAWQRSLLAADASFRSYDRLTDGEGRSEVLMNAPPPQEDVRPFVAIARWLKQKGYSAPSILATDEDQGFLLLEDLGDQTFTRCLAQGLSEEMLYEAATDLLADLVDAGSMAGLRPYDDETFTAEVELLTDWWFPAVTGHGLEAAEVEAYRTAWAAVLPLVRVGPTVTVLRDYHVDNLIWLPEREGHQRLGLLDFQDALTGPAVYDFISLVEDARRDMDPALREALTQRYLARTGFDEPAFRTAVAVMGAQRHAKVIGIFVRLYRRDGKPHYLKHIERNWGLLHRSLRHEALAPVRDWLDRHVPQALRGAFVEYDEGAA